MKYPIFSILLLSLFSFGVNAQEKAVVEGIIKDTMGEMAEFVDVVYKGEIIASSNSKGYFKIEVQANERFNLILKYFATPAKKFFLGPLSPNQILNKVFIYQKKVNTAGKVDYTYKRKYNHEEDGGTTLTTATLRTLPNVNGGIEALIKSQIGVSSSNELSGQFNVRGGNYDENLIYVNGFQIYKPQLVHSGQQEGLSLPHPDLVKNIKFYAGGFAAKYGDKLSSVMDVEYKRPKKFGVTVSGGLLGGSFAMENKKGRFTALTGVRYKTAKFLLKSLDVQGAYNPRFLDAQTFLSYGINDNWSINYLGHIAQNEYLSQPVSRETSFGTVQNALRLFVAMDGGEYLKYNTYTNGLSFRYDDENQFKMSFNSSLFYSQEKEYNDVLGAYRLSELDNNLGSDEFAEEAASIGAGFFINHARNDLDVIIYNFEHNGEFNKRKSAYNIQYGLKAQVEDVQDRFLEWDYSDSSQYNITPNPVYRDDSLFLSEYTKSSINVISQRYSGFVQMSNTIWDSSKTKYTIGARGQYWTLNKEFFWGPRAQFSFEPNRKYNLKVTDSLRKKNVAVRFATGYYFQSPFYRELRRLDGSINRSIKSQQSIHFVAGADWLFKAWGRDFKFLSELYYKHLDNIIPYFYDNIRVRYLAENMGSGYAAGWDTRVNGEFIKGLESWFTLSLLKTSENLNYIDTAGIEQSSGNIRRPTDRRVNFSIMFQDELLNDKSFRMNLNLLFGTALPYYLGGNARYKEGNKIPSYKRVDIGFTKVIKDPEKKSRTKFGKKIHSSFLSLEVFNLLDINNVVSYLWVKDLQNNVYGIPNYLTSRTLNIRFTLKI